MKIIEIIKKEISLVKNQRISLLLIFLYPLLAIALLGASFSGVDVSDMKSINIGIVNNLMFDSNLLNVFSNSKSISVLEYADSNELLAAIKKKEIIVGVRLTGASASDQIRTDLYYDNSNLLASRSFIEISKAIIQTAAISAAKEKLTGIWGTFVELKDNLEAEKSQVAECELPHPKGCGF